MTAFTTDFGHLVTAPDPDPYSSVNVTQLLYVLRNVGGVCLAVGAGSIVFGVFTLTYYQDILGFSFEIVLGFLAGVSVLLLGALDIYLSISHDLNRPSDSTRLVLLLGALDGYLSIKHDSNAPSASRRLVNAHNVLAHVSHILGGFYVGYSLCNLITCTSGDSTSRDTGMMSCDPENRTALVHHLSMGASFGVLIMGLGLFAIQYLVTGHRGEALTRNPHYHKCGFCRPNVVSNIVE